LAEPAEPHAPEEDTPSGTTAHLCNVSFCPICFAVTAMQPLAPEVVEHLVKAGAELLLAVKAVVEAKTEPAHPEGDQGRRLERIDIA
jgi:hypothetical protein